MFFLSQLSLTALWIFPSNKPSQSILGRAAEQHCRVLMLMQSLQLNKGHWEDLPGSQAQNQHHLTSRLQHLHARMPGVSHTSHKWSPNHLSAEHPHVCIQVLGASCLILGIYFLIFQLDSARFVHRQCDLYKRQTAPILMIAVINCW